MPDDPLAPAAARRELSSARDAALRARVRRVLRGTFGIARLRAGQETVIHRVLAGLPTVAIMPTGAGKSLCYQLPALLLPGLTLVVSPLIALMKDQCDKLAGLGVAAVQLNSSRGAGELQAAEESIASGRARLVFTTPERLADRDFIALLATRTVSLLAVDEAHCISQWGHDFRPAFLEIGGAVPLLGYPAILALTATATQAVVDDIGAQLGVPDFGIVNTGTYRPNLHYAVEQVRREEDKLSRLAGLLRATPGSGIVYAATVKTAEEVTAALALAGESVARYHGRVPAAERRANQDAFMGGQVRVMVATNAFGLGIDKPDIRFVVHYQMPSGLDAYYQESGRAGRDGEVAQCTLLYLRKDKAVQQFFLAGRYPALDDVTAIYRQLLTEPPATGGWTAERLLEVIDRPASKLHVALRLLRQQHVVRQDRDGRLVLHSPDLEDEALASLARAWRDRRESDRAMLEQMVFYGQTGYCRWRVLLAHFGEDEGFTRCGNCDNCRRVAAADEQRHRRPARRPDPLRQQRPVPPVLPFGPGARVRVPRYGFGQVDSSDERSVTVLFPNGEKRCFLRSYVTAATGA